MSEYKSVEQKLEEKVLAPLGHSLYEIARGFYGASATILRLPTLYRKSMNEQTLEDHKPLECETILGGAAGFLAGAYCLSYSVVVVIGPERDFVPAAILLGTNLLSGIYELGRLPKSIDEYRNLQRKKR